MLIGLCLDAIQVHLISNENNGMLIGLCLVEMCTLFGLGWDAHLGWDARLGWDEMCE